MKVRRSGVSVVIALGASLFVLTVSLFLLLSIFRSINRSVNIERATQVFYATESGVEAAFFHHNARGKGTHFCPDSGNPDRCDMNSLSDSQKLLLKGVNALVQWSLNGRRSPVFGLLKEGQHIELPLFWDSAEDPTEVVGVMDSANSVQHTFFYDTSVPGTARDYFRAKYRTDFIIPDTYRFGDKDKDEIFVDWRISRKNGFNIENFELSYDKTVDNPCESPDLDDYGYSDLCEQNFYRETDPLGYAGSFGSAGFSRDGFILSSPPTPTTSANFLFGGTNHIFSFKPLLSFVNTETSIPENVGKKIAGIPYMIVSPMGPPPLPRPEFIVTSQVKMSSFVRTISFDVPEKSTIGLFNYVILE